MIIKKIFIAGLFTLLTVSVQAQNKGFALGAQLFSPTGISAKYAISESSSITGATSFRLNDFNNYITLQGNFILNGSKDQFNIESGLLRSYYGIGLNLIFQERGDASIGFRIPIGVEYALENQPLEIYMDVAPTLSIKPNTMFYFDSSMGVRYFF
tara:strand:+ start:3079 stop:3543 length:465 start_codon:yes stop_codon:yes gene_type:complete